MEVIKATEKWRAQISDLILASKIGELDADEPIDTFFAAVDGGTLLGCAQVIFFEGEAAFRYHVVDKPYRKQGIGGKLVDVRVQAARDAGATMIALSTKFYNYPYFVKRGWKTMHRWDLPAPYWYFIDFNDPDETQTAVLLRYIVGAAPVVQVPVQAGFAF